MIVLALLAVALVVLVIGLLQSSSIWLIGSLVLSVLAGVALYRIRDTLRPPARAPDAEPASRASAPSLVSGRAFETAAEAPPSELPVAERSGPSDSVQTQAPAAAPGTQAPGTQAPGTQAPGTPTAEPMLAQPAAKHVSAPTDPAQVEVWVEDGRPRYHREQCEFIQGREAEPIPLEQAVEDGFVACSLCEP